MMYLIWFRFSNVSCSIVNCL